MKFFSIFVVIFIVLFAVLTTAFRLQSKITNGKSANSGQFPFFSLLVFPVNAGTSVVCGGSLISSEFILTAAHCTMDSDRVKATLGYLSTNDNTETQQFLVSKANFFVHSSFTSDKMTNDIALIRLPQMPKLTPTVQPIKLSVQRFNKYVDVVAIGSGSTTPNTHGMAPILQYAHLKTISMEMCFKFYTYLTSECDLICAWSPNSSIYRGDSGGPLIESDDGTLFGISSFGNQKGIEKNVPQAFTFLPFHFEWISKITELNLPKQ